MTPAGEFFREHARRVIHTARLARDSMSDAFTAAGIASQTPYEVAADYADFDRRPYLRVRYSPVHQGDSQMKTVLLRKLSSLGR